MVAAMGKSFGSFSGNVAGIEAVAGARFGFELRPELADLQAVGDPLPELLETHSEGRTWRGRRLGSCCHGRQ